MNVLLVEDDLTDVAYFKLLAGKIPLIRQVIVAQTLTEAIPHLHNKSVELVFWDIYLPDNTGFEVLKTFRNCPPVVALTSDPSFSVEAFTFGFLDYLLKPYSFERLLISINRLVDYQKMTKQAPEDFVFMKVGREMRKIYLNQILYGEARATFTMLYLTSKEQVLVSDSISDVLTTLSTNNFLRIQKSYFVNQNHIHSIEAHKIKLVDHITELPIGKIYREQFEQLLNR
jgi:DNA-binding LytR/AlgR family response regulator